MEQHYGRPLMKLPLSLFTANLTEAFRHHGWGALRIDFSRYAQGLLVVEVPEPIIGGSVRTATGPVEGLLAAFLAGMFSAFAGLELECVQTECRTRTAGKSRFVLTVLQRLEAVAPMINARPHDEIVEELCQRRSSDQ